MDKNIKMLSQAARFASEAEPGKCFFLGCLALRSDGVLVKAINLTVIVPDPNQHAEARALRKADTGSILWVARILRDRKTWAMAKPCRYCQALIKNRGVIKVYYTIAPNEYGVWQIK